MTPNIRIKAKPIIKYKHGISAILLKHKSVYDIYNDRGRMPKEQKDEHRN